MQLNKIFILCIFLVFISSCGKSKNIEIMFEDGFLYSSQNQIISELKKSNSKQEIKNTLVSQDWIKDFKINFRIDGNVKIYIFSKIPLFVWNDAFYVDKNINTFKFDETEHNLISVFCPSNQIEDAKKLVEYLNNLQLETKFSFIKLDFKYSSGWTLFSENNITIKFGKDISSTRLNSFKQSLNYVYENKSIPSMIDLRYKDGVALNYGK